MKAQVAWKCLLLAAISLTVSACGASDPDQRSKLAFGLRASGEATAEDVGLPTYPGSKPYKECGESSSAADLAVSTAAFHFNVVAVKLQTRDSSEKVEDFYRRALSKYGRVLECRDGGQRRWKSDAPGAAPSDDLECDRDEPGEHSVVYKVGTEKNQRIVAIEPAGKGTRFSLVHLGISGSDD